MKIRSTHINGPKSSISLKKFLVRLNLDLDHIKMDISLNEERGFNSQHSISNSSSYLTNVEVAALHLEDRRFFLTMGLNFGLCCVPLSAIYLAEP